VRYHLLFRDYIETLFIALFVAVLVRMFILTAYKIPTASMLPTLKAGDFVFAYRLPYGLHVPFSTQKVLSFKKPNRGDVIVFRYPGDDSLSFIKRVVGVEGDKVELRGRRLYVNDQPAVYEKAELSGSNTAGGDYYSTLTENLLGSTRLVMFRKGAEATKYGPEVVPMNHIFVLGDNRDSSDDSRYWGMIPVDRVDGRVVTIWLSLDWEEGLIQGSFPKIRWERVFAAVH
jgi:signal peptidase I